MDWYVKFVWTFPSASKGSARDPRHRGTLRIRIDLLATVLHAKPFREDPERGQLQNKVRFTFWMGDMADVYSRSVGSLLPS